MAKFLQEYAENLRFMYPARYQITIQGDIDGSWIGILCDFQVDWQEGKSSDGILILTGEVRDQAELAGILNTIYRLHLPLIEVRWLGWHDKTGA